MLGLNEGDLDFMMPTGAGSASNPLGGGIPNAPPTTLPDSSSGSGGMLDKVFGAGGILEKMADAQNPLLKGSGLPLWAKALMTAKFGGFSGGKAFGMDFTGMGDIAKDAQAQEVLDKYFKDVQAGGGGSPPAVLKNESTTTTPVRRVSPVGVGSGGASPTANDLLGQMLSAKPMWRV